MGGFPAHLSLGQPPVVRLPGGEIDGPRFDDRLEYRQGAPRARAGLDRLARSNKSQSPLPRGDFSQLARVLDRRSAKLFRKPTRFAAHPRGVQLAAHRVQNRKVFSRL